MRGQDWVAESFGCSSYFVLLYEMRVRRPTQVCPSVLSRVLYTDTHGILMVILLTQEN